MRIAPAACTWLLETSTLSTSICTASLVPATSNRSEPSSVTSSAESTSPLPSTRTPPDASPSESAVSRISDPLPVVWTRAWTRMSRRASRSIVASELKSAAMTMSAVATSSPLSVMVPAPAVRDAFTSTSPVIAIPPPVPAVVLIAWSTVIVPPPPRLESIDTAAPFVTPLAVTIPFVAPTMSIARPSSSRNVIEPLVLAAS